MRIMLSSFMSLDGLVQAPGGPEEDTDGGFTHGAPGRRWPPPGPPAPAIRSPTA